MEQSYFLPEKSTSNILQLIEMCVTIKNVSMRSLSKNDLGAEH